MSAPRTAVLTMAHGRHGHLLGQVAGLAAGRVRPDLHVVVPMGDPALTAEALPIERPGWRTVLAPIDVVDGELPLAAARNRAAEAALEHGAQVLVFLDVDCIPGLGTVERYAAHAAAHDRAAPALWCGDVAYLPPPPVGGYPLDRLHQLARPRADRPVLDVGQTLAEPAFERFWSLSFAMTAPDFVATGGFCERYVGYGGEDTDFAQVVRDQGGSLTWLGGATAYHQHHESAMPPVQHLEAVVRNAGVFHDRWGWWPMLGWLEAFADAGLAEVDASGRWRVR